MLKFWMSQLELEYHDLLSLFEYLDNGDGENLVPGFDARTSDFVGAGAVCAKSSDYSGISRWFVCTCIHSNMLRFLRIYGTLQKLSLVCYLWFDSSLNIFWTFVKGWISLANSGKHLKSMCLHANSLISK